MDGDRVGVVALDAAQRLEQGRRRRRDRCLRAAIELGEAGIAVGDLLVQLRHQDPQLPHPGTQVVVLVVEHVEVRVALLVALPLLPSPPDAGGKLPDGLAVLGLHRQAVDLGEHSILDIAGTHHPGRCRPAE